MLLTIQHASALIGVSVQTLRRWDKSGILRARRQPGGRYRLYDEEELRAWLARERPAPTTEVALTRDPSLVGRAAELEELSARFVGGSNPTVVLGPAGVGKTRLVRDWASRIEELVYAHVGPCSTPEQLALTLGAALHVPSRTPNASQLTSEIEQRLRSRPGAVVVLDEIENLDPEAVAFLGRLVGLVRHVVVTTRVRPYLPGETVVRLDALPHPKPTDRDADNPSVRLFLERLRLPGTAPREDDETLAAAVEIASRLQGLPLALELAAARAAAIGVERVRAELRASIDVLDRPRASLRRAFESSFRRLSERTREVLEHAVLLPDAFVVDELERVTKQAVVDPLQTLVEHSLIRAQHSVGGSAVTFSVHGLVRDLVVQALPDGRRAWLHEQHRLFLAEEAGRLAMDTSTAGLARLRHLEPALLRSWEAWASGAKTERVEDLVDVARALGRLAEALGPSPSIVSVLERSVKLSETLDVSQGRRADLLRHRAFTHLFQSELEAARGGYQAALALARTAGESSVEARVLCQLAWIALRDGDVRVRDQAIDEAEETLLKHADPLAAMELATLRGQVDVLSSKFASARRHFEKARLIAVRMRDQTSETTATGFLGVVAFEEGAIEESVAHYDRAIASAMACGSSVFEAIYRGYRAIALHHTGDARALAAYDDAIRVARGAHAVRFEKLFQAWQAALLAAQGELERAIAAFDSAAELTDPQAVAFFEMHRAHLDLAWADRAAPGSEERARHEARACRRLDGARVGPSTPRELRVGRRFLERTLRARTSVAGAAGVIVGWQGRSVVVGSRSVSLGSRQPLQRIVWELTLRRILEPGVPIAARELFAVAWQGESATAESALHRLHVALSTLRRLGLRDLIELADGYRLTTELSVAIRFGS